jgi:hypothetical protein
MHRRVTGRGWWLLGLLLPFAACDRTPEPSEQPGRQSSPSIGPAAPDTTLEGSFGWTTLNDAPAPTEFPAGSGTTLVSGTLQLDSAAAARRDGSGRFGLRFTMRASASDSAQTTGQDGRFRIAADSLLFTPDGQEDRPPVRFRYAWRPDGTLALTDDQGHVWAYERR